MSSINFTQLPKGLWPVMLTPFNEDNSIDYQTLEILTDFYINSGANGLFVNCLSSEMYQLTSEERLKLTKKVVDYAGGKVPVVSTGTFGGDLQKQVEFIRKVSETGADAVIIVTSNLASEKEDDDILLENLKSISEATGEIQLGTYECPDPYKRLLNPKIMKWIANSSKFCYHKDTSCNLDDIKTKIEITKGTNLNFYNANTPTALDSLRLGGDGLTPVSANFYPELYSYLYENYSDKNKESTINELQRMLTLLDGVTRYKYPLMAKAFLRKRGIPIKLEQRIPQENLTYEEEKIMNSLYSTVENIIEELGIGALDIKKAVND